MKAQRLFPPAVRAGFTLLEIVITLAVAAILLGVAAPSLRDAMMNVQLSGQVNDLLTDLSMARSEAVKRRVQTGVCAGNATGTACSGANTWEQGWIVFIDADADGAVDTAAGSVIKWEQPLDGKNTLVRTDAGGGSGTSRVAYGAAGTVVGGVTGMAFRLCDPRKIGKTIDIALSGRASVNKTPPNNCP